MLKKSVLFISSLFSIPLVYALESPFGSPVDFGEFIGSIGQVLHSLVTNKYSSFFILAIILFILLYNIFKAPMQKITVFQGAPGKSIAVALTLLSELGIFYKARETGIDGLLSGIFGANNIFVGIVIVVLLFLFWRKVLGN
ncbi:hypothetical protein KY313_01175 [Candidatus Woesearchaeota archaeon]|jgi:hypothetical protein|nr:hypothetical protein [Candidatus Woesearchaeota archaeon]